MDIPKQRRMLNLVSGGLIAGALGGATWSLWSLDTEPANVPPSKPVVAKAQQADVEDTTRINQQIANLDLRRPLVDPPPPKPREVTPRPTPPAPVRPAPRPALTLVGTMVESGKSMAIIADASGNFDVKGVGESLSLSPTGVTVERITSEQVDIQLNGSTTTLTIDKKAKRAGGGGKNPGKQNRRRVR